MTYKRIENTLRFAQGVIITDKGNLVVYDTKVRGSLDYYELVAYLNIHRGISIEDVKISGIELYEKGIKLIPEDPEFRAFLLMYRDKKVHKYQHVIG